MKKVGLLFIIICSSTYLIFSCSTHSRENTDIEDKSELAEVNLDSIYAAHYREDAVLVNQEGRTFQTSEEKEVLLNALYANGIVADTIASQIADLKSIYTYQIIQANKFTALQVIENAGNKIALQFLAKPGNDNSWPPAIDQQRIKWMELCNSHKVEKLITQLYTANTLYFNKGSLISGHNKLIEEYQYMARPQYNLKLSPLNTFRVSDTIAFEIGQCSGSYPNKYVLVWQKEASGDWKILLDSNV